MLDFIGAYATLEAQLACVLRVCSGGAFQGRTLAVNPRMMCFTQVCVPLRNQVAQGTAGQDVYPVELLIDGLGVAFLSFADTSET